MSRRPSRAELEAYAVHSDKAASRFDEAARDAEEALATETRPEVRAQYEAMSKFHQQHANEAREDSATYRDGRIPGEQW
ncbi:hypothetical protein OG552_10625 [Streptomyces sp. NBC_01476]|uniref:hypothetical protein n=1 Tax=Streptomyces sp. NBC_01476 TaxID=2903881 RepID=UPI002E37B33A|nr:hypothetical protein [Streptomyces sp. NBC_01476]